MNLVKINSEFEPVQAIVVYQSRHDGAYLELHDVKSGKLAEGRPLSVETMRELLSKVEDKPDIKAFKGIIPESILYYNCDPSSPIIVWYEKPQRRNLLFERDVKSGMAHIPGMIFKFHGGSDGSLDVFSFKHTGSRPDDDTKLFLAPFPNISDMGDVCMGNVDMYSQADSINDLIEEISSKFWNSTFTHFNNEQVLEKANAFDVYTKLIGSDMKFPEEFLKKSRVKMKDLCKSK